jgi:uncharacterized membrane protein YeaQ/YmgE (transglycosylase-associated protein family)
MSWKKFIPSLCFLALMWWELPFIFLSQGRGHQVFSASFAVSTVGTAVLLLILEVFFNFSTRAGLIIEWNVILALYLASFIVGLLLSPRYPRGGHEHWEDVGLELGYVWLLTFLLYATLGNAIVISVWSVRRNKRLTANSQEVSEPPL